MLGHVLHNACKNSGVPPKRRHNVAFGLGQMDSCCSALSKGDSAMSCATVTLTVLVMAISASIASAQNQPHSMLPSSTSSAAASSSKEWHFIVSGDSRNCGDLVMPAIAADAAQYHPAFYWHLGDLRAIYEMDEDYAGELNHDGTLRPWDMTAYTNAAWDDFIQMQIKPFQDRGMPFLIGIGNHENILPKTREKFIAQFADWLDSPVLRDQRIKDAQMAIKDGKHPGGEQARQVKTYYHWTDGGVDFINLDNSTAEQFDQTQMAWLHQRLEYDRANPEIHTIIVGMHESLPNSLSNFHSMSETPAGEQSGRCTYRHLEKIQREDHKQVYVLSSHSHFIMTNIYDTPFWHEHAPSILPGILVGTAGAVRYRLPVPSPAGHENAAACIRDAQSFCAQTDVYGYLLATVNAKGKPGNIEFQFKEIKAENVPAGIRQMFSSDTIKVCFEGNKQISPSVDTTQYLPDGPCPY
jgi:Calcineurin-like phosphoesterase